MPKVAQLPLPLVIERPLAFESSSGPRPLSEVEEALIAWAALGPNGIITADIPVQGDLSSLLSWAGRTVPASSNDQAVDNMMKGHRRLDLRGLLAEADIPADAELEMTPA